MNATTLLAAKTVAGSIKRQTNYSQIDADVILEEAQTLLYQTLRVREMRTMWSASMAIGDSSKALPSDFLDPTGRATDTQMLRYSHVTQDVLMNSRIYTAAGALESGQPTRFAIWDEAINFDVKFSAVTTFLLPYFKQPAPLAITTNETNFLTRRYPHLLRQACVVRSHAFMKAWSAMEAEMKFLSPLIERANAEADMAFYGADYDQDIP